MVIIQELIWGFPFLVGLFFSFKNLIDSHLIDDRFFFLLSWKILYSWIDDVWHATTLILEVEQSTQKITWNFYNILNDSIRRVACINSLCWKSF